MRSSAWPLPCRLLVVVAAASVLCSDAVEAASHYYDTFEYPFVLPETHRSEVLHPTEPPPVWRQYYPENFDFSDYSQHMTRSVQTSRNSANQLVPSGPYFAQELKSYYHKKPAEPKIYHTSWNMLDSEGNEYANIYNRPGLTQPQRPSSMAKLPPDHPIVMMDAWHQQQMHHQHQQILNKHYHQLLAERPIRKPLTKKPVRKKNKVRPIHPAGYQQHLSKVPSNNKHPNSIDKVSEGLVGQSIASAYPNGVMGTLSLMAGLVWYLVNKSATPVVKMRHNSESNRSGDDDSEIDEASIENAISQLADYWMGSLKEDDCQQRAVCELVSQSPWLSTAARWSQSAYWSPMVQKAVESMKEENNFEFNLDEDQSKFAQLVRAASHGERGVDCAAFYPECSLPFREESRDRRR